MDNIVVMRGLNGRQDLFHHIDNALIRNREVFNDIVFQIRAFDILHHQKLLAVTFTHIINRHNIGMDQFTCRHGFTLKSAHRIRVILKIKP